MSGSPVFVDGRLVGAVAYAFPFGKEPIAGITPIGDMIEAAASAAPRAASARLHARGAPLAAPLDRAAVAAALRRPLRSLVPGALPRRAAARRPWPGPPSARSRCRSSSPASSPTRSSGRAASSPSMGFAPVMGGGGGAGARAPSPTSRPGAAVGVSLVEGDLDLSVTGTVTHVDGDRVYAFGHPFYNLGPTRFPMKKAWVYSVFPSLQVSWKIAAALDAGGHDGPGPHDHRSPAASARPPA